MLISIIMVKPSLGDGICSQYGFLTNHSHITRYLVFTVSILDALTSLKCPSDLPPSLESPRKTDPLS